MIAPNGFDPTGLTALYRLYDVSGALLYVGVTSNLVSRLRDHSKKGWWAQVHSRRIEWFDDRQKAEELERYAIDTECPIWNDRDSPWTVVVAADGRHAVALRRSGPAPSQEATLRRETSRHLRSRVTTCIPAGGLVDRDNEGWAGEFADVVPPLSGSNETAVPAGVLDRSAVAAILGVKPKTVSEILIESKPGGRYADHPFPPPDGRIGRGPWWRRERAAEIRAWDAGRPGRGVGGGRPRKGTDRPQPASGAGGNLTREAFEDAP